MFVLRYMKAIFTFKSNAFLVFPSVIIIHTVSDIKTGIIAIFKVICRILPFLIWFPHPPPLSMCFFSTDVVFQQFIVTICYTGIISSISWIYDKRHISILEGKIRICQMSVYKGDLLSVAHLVVWWRREEKKSFHYHTASYWGTARSSIRNNLFKTEVNTPLSLL
jgi:hypothetical protein